MRLSALLEGEKCIVKSLTTSGKIRRRLLELGVIEGTEICCLGKSPLGDPTAYFIRGAVIALRKEDADTIIIEREEG